MPARLYRRLRPVRESLPGPFGTNVLYRDSSIAVTFTINSDRRPRGQATYFDEFTNPVICNPGSNTGLVISYRDRHHRHSLCQRLQSCI